jgi:hypothetical protein
MLLFSYTKFCPGYFWSTLRSTWNINPRSTFLKVHIVTCKTYLQFGLQQIRCVAHKLKPQNSKMVVTDIPNQTKNTVVNPWKFHRIKSTPKFNLQKDKFPSINPNILNVSLSVYKTITTALSYKYVQYTDL